MIVGKRRGSIHPLVRGLDSNKGYPNDLGPLLFNLYLNDLFYQLSSTLICNFADDTTVNVFNKDISELLNDLESDTLSSIIWFENNFMKINSDKCHFLISGNINEHLWVNS